MTTDKRANFGTKLGVILASAGSAVGLGNIWRFPYMTGEYGGAAFILTYLGCVLLFGAPIMMAEFIIGRRSQSNTARAYQKLAPGTHWRWVGRMGVLAGFLILSYYAVVAGWTLEYMVDSAIGTFADKGPSDFVRFYESFVSNPWLPVVWTIVFLLLTHFIVVRGVEKGIERSSKVMMPALFILLLILAVCAMLLPGAERGLEFLLKPDLGKVDGSVLLAAMGQAFFSLSVGMGCLCTYASYFKPDPRQRSAWPSLIPAWPSWRASSSSLPPLRWASSPTLAPACCLSPCPTSSNRLSATCLSSPPYWP